jgi:hypothetical protein
MSVRGKPGDFFTVKILGMRFRIASAHLPYTCRDYLRIVRRIPSRYRKGCAPRFDLGITCDPSLENRSPAGFLWAFQNRRNA